MWYIGGKYLLELQAGDVTVGLSMMRVMSWEAMCMLEVLLPGALKVRDRKHAWHW